MAMSPRERCTTEGIRRSRTAPSALAVPMVAATVWLCAAVLGLAGPNAALAQGAVTVEPPVAPLAVTVPTSPQPAPPPVIVPEGEPLPVALPPVPVPIPDPVAQVSEPLTHEAIGLISSPIVNFAGLSSGSQPPDVTGAVGRNHFVEMLNATQFQVWDKQGNSLAGPTTFGGLWPGGSTCNSNAGDPIVVYDHLADRWLLSQFANPNHMCVAISQTPNPAAGTWFLYTFNTGVFPDYPKFGVWPDGYYMSSYEGSNLGVFVFDRANMLLGNAAGFMKTTISTLTPSAGVRDTRILPGNLVGPPPPDGTPNFFVRPVDGQQDTGNPTDRVEIWEARVNWTTSTFTFPLVATLSPAAFNIMVCNRNGAGVRDCIPEPNTTATVDALSNRAMMQANYHTFGSSQRLVLNQTINVAGALGNAIPFVPVNEVAGVRWYELEDSGAGWTIRQQGTYAPQPLGATAENQLLHRWMGSAAQDAIGNIALGYNITNSDTANPVFPSIRYTGRRFDDPLNLMPQGEQVILNGTASLGANGSFGNRWGDYSQMTVDPVDGCTFWYVQMVAGGATQIASFRFDTCGTDLAISKSASPSPATAGGLLTYTITVMNNGPLDATDVTVVDTLPAGTTYQANSDSCVQGPPGTLTCTLGTIAAGSTATFTVQVLVGSGVAGSITNTARVSADQTDLDPSNNQASVTTIVNGLADLSLTKQCKPDTPIAAGGTATCTIFVDNLGPSNAQNVVVTDTNLSNGSFTIVSATTTAGVCVVASGVVTCNLGTEPAGARITMTVTVTSNNQVDINDTATVTSSTTDPNTANNSAQGAVHFIGSANLQITKTSAPNPVIAGTNVTYTINVTNNGPSAAANVVVTDTLPGQISDVTFTPSVGSCIGGIPGNPALPLTCNLGNLANGGSATITIVAKVAASTPNGTILVNNAVVRSDYADPNNGNNNATALTTVNTRADLAIVKTSDQITYKPSSLVTYTVTVTNNGPSDAQAVVVTDNLPDIKQAIYQGDTGGCTKSGNTLTCNMGTLTVGQSKSFNINEIVKGARGAVSNTATVNSSTVDPNTSNNTSTQVVTVQGGG